MRSPRRAVGAVVAALAPLLLAGCGGPAAGVKPPPPADPSLTARTGIVVVTNSSPIGKLTGARQERGVVVLFVQPGGPAERADIRVGDLITKVDGRDSRNAELAVVQLRARPREKRRIDVITTSGRRRTAEITAEVPSGIDLRRLYAPLIAQRPNDAVLRYLRAQTLRPAGDLKGALADLDVALRLSSGFTDALSLKGEIYWEMSRQARPVATRGRHQTTALQSWQRAVELDRRNIRALASLSQSAAELGQSPAAIRLAEGAIKNDDQFAGAHYSLGLAYHVAKRYADAAGSARRAVELNPFDARYYELLASSFRRLDRADDCRKTLQALFGLITDTTQKAQMLDVCT